MKHSTDRILTTHAGSLSRPANLIAMSKAIAVGESKGDAAYAQCLAASVADVVKKQRELGVDIPDDGEFGKPVGGSYDYGAWWNYAFARMSGFSPAGSPAAAAHETQHKKSTVADVALTSFANRRDWQKFGEFYLDPESSGSLMGDDPDRRRRRRRSGQARLGRQHQSPGWQPDRGELVHVERQRAGRQAFGDPARSAAEGRDRRVARRRQHPRLRHATPGHAERRTGTGAEARRRSGGK